MTEQAAHYALEYAKRVNELLHSCLWPTWFYKHEVYEVPNVATGLFITYDNQKDDEFEIHTNVKWKRFRLRLTKITKQWASLSLNTMKKLSKSTEKTIGGWERRTIYFFKGGNDPNSWMPAKAETDVYALLAGASKTWGPLVLDRVSRVRELIPSGRDHFKDYQDHVRVTINFLFIGQLGEAKPQVRIESGLEIRDLICQNRSDSGFWKDLKDKYSCTEILFDAKNTEKLTREDIRQVYSYLKPAMGLWGFIVCRAPQGDNIIAFNREQFNNYQQKRGVLILTDDDLLRMARIKLSKQDPSEYMRDRMSEFVRSV